MQKKKLNWLLHEEILYIYRKLCKKASRVVIKRYAKAAEDLGYDVICTPKIFSKVQEICELI